MLSHVRSAYEKVVCKLRDKKGQGLVEYALILVLIAIVVMAAVKGVGTTTNGVFTQVDTALQNK